jgi:hypothetical protein
MNLTIRKTLVFLALDYHLNLLWFSSKKTHQRKQYAVAVGGLSFLVKGVV